MAERRQRVVFSASPANAEAQFVLQELAKMPERERSRALWAWAASYLRGQAREVKETQIDAAMFDDIADLLGAL